MAAEAPAPRRFWIGVVSREHVQRALEGGFMQLNHGKQTPLKRMNAGDGIAIYSPRTAYPDGEPLQAFTAIGVIKTGEVYQVEMTEDFRPYRIDVRFLRAKEAPIRPLVNDLSFIRSKTNWGGAFRFGCTGVPVEDFRLIARAMGVHGEFA